MSKGKSNFSIIFGVCGIVMEIKVTEKDEVVELLRVRTVKSIRFFGLRVCRSWFGRGVSSA